jgi:dihydrodipicolinate synthase/N-acetylneuraminate lyase
MTLSTNRRGFLKGASALAGAAAIGGLRSAQAAAIAKSPNGKPLAGVFPIGWTVCTPDNKLNLDAMTAQQKFLNRGKVAGIAWPQNASAWQTLSAQEWHSGVDAITSVKGPTAVVLGVQTVGFDLAKSTEYARYAKSKNADGIISFVPTGASDADAIAYFKALSDASSLPMMVQAVGDVSVDTLVALSNALPSIVAVKDEAGDPLERSTSLLQRTGGKLEDFSGGGGHSFFPEMELGFLGTCPYTGMSDILQQSFDLYQAGKKREAYDMFGRFLSFDALPHANEYVMKARGVFADDAIMRVNPPAGGGGGGRGGRAGGAARGGITEAQKAEIRLALNTYLKPYLIA